MISSPPFVCKLSLFAFSFFMWSPVLFVILKFMYLFYGVYFKNYVYFFRVGNEPFITCLISMNWVLPISATQVLLILHMIVFLNSSLDAYMLNFSNIMVGRKV